MALNIACKETAPVSEGPLGKVRQTEFLSAFGSGRRIYQPKARRGRYRLLRPFARRKAAAVNRQFSSGAAPALRTCLSRWDGSGKGART